MTSLTYYPLWKITGAGRKKTRYYETYKQFEKYKETLMKYNQDFITYQYTSNGWREMIWKIEQYFWIAMACQ